MTPDCSFTTLFTSLFGLKEKIRDREKVHRVPLLTCLQRLISHLFCHSNHPFLLFAHTHTHPHFSVLIHQLNEPHSFRCQVISIIVFVNTALFFPYWFCDHKTINRKFFTLRRLNVSYIIKTSFLSMMMCKYVWVMINYNFIFTLKLNTWYWSWCEISQVLSAWRESGKSWIEKLSTKVTFLPITRLFSLNLITFDWLLSKICLLFHFRQKTFGI